MVAILDSITLRPGGEMSTFDIHSGKELEVLPTFTCVHCNIVVVVNPLRQRPRETCKQCMKWTCGRPGCVEECRDFAEVDGALAANDHLGQPWFLRDAEGYPVDRVWVSESEFKLIRRKDNGLTRREMARTARPLILPEYMVTLNRMMQEAKENAA